MKTRRKVQKKPKTPGERVRKAVEQLSKAAPKGPRMEIRSNMVYTGAQLAEILQVGIRTSRAILRQGEIPARKIGQEWRVLGENIRTYLQDFRPLEDKERGSK